jgi:hypothetical protein
MISYIARTKFGGFSLRITLQKNKDLTVTPRLDPRGIIENIQVDFALHLSHHKLTASFAFRMASNNVVCHQSTNSKGETELIHSPERVYLSLCARILLFERKIANSSNSQHGGRVFRKSRKWRAFWSQQIH